MKHKKYKNLNDIPEDRKALLEPLIKSLDYTLNCRCQDSDCCIACVGNSVYSMPRKILNEEIKNVFGAIENLGLDYKEINKKIVDFYDTADIENPNTSPFQILNGMQRIRSCVRAMDLVSIVDELLLERDNQKLKGGKEENGFN